MTYISLICLTLQVPTSKPTAPVAAVVPRKNGRDIFERGENLLYNGILHFVFRFSQLSEIALNLRRREIDFSERGMSLKGLTSSFEK